MCVCACVHVHAYIYTFTRACICMYIHTHKPHIPACTHRFFHNAHRKDLKRRIQQASINKRSL